MNGFCEVTIGTHPQLWHLFTYVMCNKQFFFVLSAIDTFVDKSGFSVVLIRSNYHIGTESNYIWWVGWKRNCSIFRFWMGDKSLANESMSPLCQIMWIQLENVPIYSQQHSTFWIGWRENVNCQYTTVIAANIKLSVCFNKNVAKKNMWKPLWHISLICFYYRSLLSLVKSWQFRLKASKTFSFYFLQQIHSVSNCRKFQFLLNNLRYIHANYFEIDKNNDNGWFGM